MAFYIELLLQCYMVKFSPASLTMLQSEWLLILELVEMPEKEM